MQAYHLTLQILVQVFHEVQSKRLAADLELTLTQHKNNTMSRHRNLDKVTEEIKKILDR
jgi:hypothetical protein